MKNVVFIPNINLGDGRSESYNYSIQSWKHFCDKYDCELLVLDELLFPIEHMKVTWQRFYLFDLLKDVDYDQILMVDADTIVHPNCPNFFELTNHEYSAVVNNGSFEWVKRSVDKYSELMFDNKVPFKLWEYINCGFQIVNKKHKPFFEYVKNYYESKQDLIRNSIERVKAGTDQTIINFLLREQNIKINYLPISYNLQDLNSKQLLFLDERMWFKDDIIFKDCGWVYHFNAIPPNPMNRDAKYWIKRTYEELYG
jgi:lipopolysaccharide biosynthesis glycosyltransferase|tara:strand:- start:324 stop:1088 length:765 start_codon:yes stop_codon:yes gene_type:complete